MLYRFALGYGARQAEAEDVVQHCMTAVHEHISGLRIRYPKKGRFKGWLRTLVNNRIRNLLRGRRDRIAESGEFAALAAGDAPPEDIFEKVWVDEHLKYSLAQVKQEVEEKTFKAFQYYVIEERSVEDICGELDMTPNQVHKCKYRLMKKLSDKMALLMEG